jgi:hypothetical protein
MRPYKVGTVSTYLHKKAVQKNFMTFTAFAKEFGLNPELLKKYIRGDVRFDLHYFMTLLEGLELDVTEFYGKVYQQDKEKGRI